MCVCIENKLRAENRSHLYKQQHRICSYLPRTNKSDTVKLIQDLSITASDKNRPYYCSVCIQCIDLETNGPKQQCRRTQKNNKDHEKNGHSPRLPKGLTRIK